MGQRICSTELLSIRFLTILARMPEMRMMVASRVELNECCFLYSQRSLHT